MVSDDKIESRQMQIPVLRMHYSSCVVGNPVLCNCNIRPLKHYLAQLIEIPTSYSSIVCDLPVHSRGHNLINVSDDALQCFQSENRQKADNDDFSVLPDLRYREVFL